MMRCNCLVMGQQALFMSPFELNEGKLYFHSITTILHNNIASNLLATFSFPFFSNMTLALFTRTENKNDFHSLVQKNFELM